MKKEHISTEILPHPKKSFDRLVIKFDGSCGPRNPGGNMGYGYSISDKDTGNLLAHGWGYTLAQGKTTSNNLAEWRALVKGLELLLETGIEYRQLFIYGDSSLVINQAKGRWKVKEGTYAPEATSALKRFSKVFKSATIEWVRREDNKHCDMLSNKYIDHLMREYGFDTGGEFKKPKKKKFKKI